MTANAYEALMAYQQTTGALSQVSGLLSWDQEVMMPPKGGQSRAEQLAAMEEILHQRRCDPRLGDWLDQLDGIALNETQAANVRLIRRSYQRSKKIPVSLAQELARATSLAQGIWASARSARNFADFAPTLENMVKLKRQEAECLGNGHVRAYDALLDDYEPGMTTAVLQRLLQSLRPRLSSLRQRIAESNVTQPTLSGRFSKASQLALSRQLANTLGYDLEAGRLDESTHPFSSGTPLDSRITTRIDENDPLGCLYSTIHELGHALYEQGLADGLNLDPANNSVSMGVHESQSRFWENQVARSRVFCNWLFPIFKQSFGNCGVEDAEQLYRVVNHVETGFIRTESDEVHYNLHILLRFELEKELIEGQLQVADLEAEWNRRFERDFGRVVPHAAAGVLQDIHWSVGLFGYFPTYTLGNIYSAQLDAAMRRDIGDVDDKLSKGRTDDLLGWMRQKIHQRGSLHMPDALIELAVGEAASPEPLLDYLEAKYGEIFDL